MLNVLNQETDKRTFEQRHLTLTVKRYDLCQRYDTGHQYRQRKKGENRVDQYINGFIQFL